MIVIICIYLLRTNFWRFLSKRCSTPFSVCSKSCFAFFENLPRKSSFTVLMSLFILFLTALYRSHVIVCHFCIVGTLSSFPRQILSSLFCISLTIGFPFFSSAFAAAAITFPHRLFYAVSMSSSMLMPFFSIFCKSRRWYDCFVVLSEKDSTFNLLVIFGCFLLCCCTKPRILASIRLWSVPVFAELETLISRSPLNVSVC